jgi:hypothetical protein
MTRSILAAVAAAVGLTIVTGGTGCNSTGVGDPCTPEAEYSQSFLGFSAQEVNLETKSFQCETRLCLANHFQGRVSCPYGQDSTGSAAGNAAADDTHQACLTPIGQTVTGIDPTTGNVGVPPAGAVGGTNQPGSVPPNCTDRTAENAVYCSCRCANVDGQTNDGSIYCNCPTGFACTQLVSGIPGQDPDLTGAYCIKNGTAFGVSSCTTPCTATQGGCGTAQGVN